MIDMSIDKAIDDFKNGKPLILLDDPFRENEADLIIHASKCSDDIVRLFRKDGGGLICLATDAKVANALELKHMADILRQDSYDMHSQIAIGKTPYGDEPAFSISINHRQTITGITDKERAVTIKEFEKLISTNIEDHLMKIEFVKNFYSPGHVNLLVGRDIHKRRGHTELALKMAERTGMSPAVVVCEMLSDSGDALNWAEAKEYAVVAGLQTIEGKEIL
jgi:3,4-dihydroxy 2-butanone 4-phosphate synthase